MEHMEEALVRTKAKDSSTIVVSGGSVSVQTIYTPLYLNGRDYELAMGNLETYYSFANILADNKLLKWRVAKRGQLSIYLQAVMNESL